MKKCQAGKPPEKSFSLVLSWVYVVWKDFKKSSSLSSSISLLSRILPRRKRERKRSSQKKPNREKGDSCCSLFSSRQWSKLKKDTAVCETEAPPFSKTGEKERRGEEQKARSSSFFYRKERRKEGQRMTRGERRRKEENKIEKWKTRRQWKRGTMCLSFLTSLSFSIVEERQENYYLLDASSLLETEPAAPAFSSSLQLRRRLQQRQAELLLLLSFLSWKTNSWEEEEEERSERKTERTKQRSDTTWETATKERERERTAWAFSRPPFFLLSLDYFSSGKERKSQAETAVLELNEEKKHEEEEKVARKARGNRSWRKTLDLLFNSFSLFSPRTKRISRKPRHLSISLSF